MSNLKFSPTELAAFREEYCKGATDSQFTVFIAECERRELVPGQHVVFQLRTSKEFDPTVNASVFVKKMVKITTIDALRLISQRTGEYEGQGEGEFYYLDPNNAPTIVSKIPLPHPTTPNTPREPWAAAIPIFRKGFRDPVKVVARFDAYAVLRKSSDQKWVLNDVWARRGPEMLLKCSEAAARRAAFPEELSGLFLAEEFNKDEDPAPATPSEPVVLAAAPTAPVVPVVNQVPAEPTNAPRPGEDKPVSPPAENKPKRGKKADPESKKPAHDRADLGITDKDIANAHKPAPEFDAAASTKEAQDFAEDVCSATPKSERIPTDEEKAKYVARIREIVKTHGVDNKTLGAWVLQTSDKFTSKELTVANWESAFEKLDAAAAAGTLKELVKQ